MKITLKVLGILSYLGKVSRTNLYFDDQTTVEEVLLRFARDKGEDFRKTLFEGSVTANYLIIVNDRNVSAESGVSAVLKDGDEVVIVPVAGGG